MDFFFFFFFLVGGHHKIGRHLGVISMHFVTFLRPRYRIGDNLVVVVWGGGWYIFKYCFGVLEIPDIYFG